MGIYADTGGAYLMHEGIKGMRWYHRRYQNEDGSLTPAGRARYLKNGGKAIDVKTGGVHKERNGGDPLYEKLMAKNIKSGKDKAPISAVESLSKDATNITNNAGNLVKAVAKQRVKNEPITMSDEDLRKAINRLNMERQYRDLTASMTNSGMERAQRILDVAGPTVGIASGIASIAATIYKLKHDDMDDENHLEHHDIKG